MFTLMQVVGIVLVSLIVGGTIGLLMFSLMFMADEDRDGD